ncbi:hypothetical protein EAG18_07080 [Pseudoalteromonas sp. J010]|nr:hypothetical protein EAG18_07080 [Pseudoalteromonas sp. J010]
MPQTYGKRYTKLLLPIAQVSRVIGISWIGIQHKGSSAWMLLPVSRGIWVSPCFCNNCKSMGEGVLPTAKVNRP